MKVWFYLPYVLMLSLNIFADSQEKYSTFSTSFIAQRAIENSSGKIETENILVKVKAIVQWSKLKISFTPTIERNSQIESIVEKIKSINNKISLKEDTAEGSYSLETLHTAKEKYENILPNLKHLPSYTLKLSEKRPAPKTEFFGGPRDWGRDIGFLRFDGDTNEGILPSANGNNLVLFRVPEPNKRKPLFKYVFKDGGRTLQLQAISDAQIYPNWQQSLVLSAVK